MLVLLEELAFAARIESGSNGSDCGIFGELECDRGL